MPLTKQHTRTINAEWHGSYISDRLSQERRNRSSYNEVNYNEGQNTNEVIS